MTYRELHKLRRSELLEILIEQKKAVANMEQQVEEERAAKAAVEASLQELDETYQRLRKKLDAKDEKIHELNDEMEHQRGMTRAAYEETETIAAVTERLNQAVEAAERAAEMYEKARAELAKKK